MPKIGKVGLSKDLASTPIESGFLFTSDTKQLYVDYNDSSGKKREQLTAEKKNVVKSVTVADGSLKVETLDGQSKDYEVGIKYDTGDATTAGIVKLYTGTGNNTDGSMTQQAITNALNEKANSSHSHAISDITDLQTTLDSKLSIESDGYVKSISIDGTRVTITKGDGSSSELTTKDTTYSVFSGATSSDAGESGLVPAPSVGEESTYLKGNGTWADVSEIVSDCVKLDGSSTMQGALNMGANNITGVGSLTFDSPSYTPTNDNDAANKAYVDDAISGVTITCDTELNNESTNPVQNKVLYSKIQELTDSIASVKSTAETALTNANSAKTVTDKYKTLLNIIGNNQ